MMARIASMRGARASVYLYKKFFLFVFTILFLGLLTMLAFLIWSPSHGEDRPQQFSLRAADTSPEVKIPKDAPQDSPRNKNCTYHLCLEVYHCGYHDETRISVYIYPYRRYVDHQDVSITLPISKEFQEILQTIADSPYYTDDPETACLYVPSLDLLNQNNVRVEEIGQVLKTLPWWNNGTNHLLFNMLPGSVPDYHSVLDVNTNNALMAGGGFSTWSYRQTYDVSIPVYNPYMAQVEQTHKSHLDDRKWHLVSAQIGLHLEYRQELALVARTDSRVLLLDKCDTKDLRKSMYQRCNRETVYKYPQILQDSTFCMVIRGSRLGQTALSDAIMTGCIPVVVADGYIMPFSEVLDWTRAAVFVREDDLADVGDILRTYTHQRICEMRQVLKLYWEKYFSSMKLITLTTLQILNDRVFPYAAWTYEQWNNPPNPNVVSNPLFLPSIPPKAMGFTAVILTFDRVESLFRVIRQVSKAASLSKVLVVWNNQKKAPPPTSAWPKIGKPLKVVQTKQNKLSNRFYPYDEIETECILAIDDDIVMLTADEMEFGYEVWREFPDRLVGFPSRLHVWDNVTASFRYDSEWTNSISMVLTGAAFHHKYFSYLYTTAMPGNIKLWVDEHMNCEDIAMNFLISNVTGKAPIKVTPRKKFKCPECVNNEMLSADLTHMVERSECINTFSEIYGMMPLKTVEFRADPVLYKDDLPPKAKQFPDIGSL